MSSSRSTWIVVAVAVSVLAGAFAFVVSPNDTPSTSVATRVDAVARRGDASAPATAASEPAFSPDQEKRAIRRLVVRLLNEGNRSDIRAMYSEFSTRYRSRVAFEVFSRHVREGIPRPDTSPVHPAMLSLLEPGQRFDGNFDSFRLTFIDETHARVVIGDVFAAESWLDADVVVIKEQGEWKVDSSAMSIEAGA